MESNSNKNGWLAVDLMLECTATQKVLKVAVLHLKEANSYHYLIHLHLHGSFFVCFGAVVCGDGSVVRF